MVHMINHFLTGKSYFMSHLLIGESKGKVNGNILELISKTLSQWVLLGAWSSRVLVSQ